jgi:hypothetical protein
MRESVDFNKKYLILKRNLEITGSESSSSAAVLSELFLKTRSGTVKYFKLFNEVQGINPTYLTNLTMAPGHVPSPNWISKYQIVTFPRDRKMRICRAVRLIKQFSPPWVEKQRGKPLPLTSQMQCVAPLSFLQRVMRLDPRSISSISMYPSFLTSF